MQLQCYMPFNYTIHHERNTKSIPLMYTERTKKCKSNSTALISFKAPSTEKLYTTMITIIKCKT